jgi:hypothetical protein
MDEPVVAMEAAGGGLGGGFCAGLCANAGESGPATRSAAIKLATNDLAKRETSRFSRRGKTSRLLFVNKSNEWTRSQRVVITILFLEILSDQDVFASN